MKKYRHVKYSEQKIDAISLATGEALFTDDFTKPDMLYLAVLRSPHAFARIRELDDSPARELDGVVEVFSHKNVPRVMFTTAGQGYPEPSPYDKALFDTLVRFAGDEVAIVAAETEEIAREALNLIRVDYEILTPLLDYSKALNEDAPIVHPEKDAKAMIPVPFHPEKNLAAEVNVEVGNFERAYKNSSGKVEATFTTPITSHCPIEPHTAMAYMDEMARLVIISSTQVPFHVRRIVSRILDIPPGKIRVIKPRIGGGFGAKQEIIVEPFVALTTWRTGRPSRLRLSRKEVFTSTRTRHGFTITMKAGFEPEDGKINALSMEALENTGAYGTHSLTVLSNSASKTLPLLNKIENIVFKGKAVYSNLPVAGAYRGYGATQGYFAYGQLIDMVIGESGGDPVEYYLKWCIKAGEGSPIFRAIGEGTEGVEMTLDTVGLPECLKKGADVFRWQEKRNRYSGEFNSGRRKKKGVGLVCMMQGSAIPKIDMASAYMKMNEDGSFNLKVGATDIGTGSDTILAQIAAEVLDTSPDKFIVHSSDTDHTPFDTGAYASSTTYLSGSAVKKCAEEILKQIKKVGSEILEVPEKELDIRDGMVFVSDEPHRMIGYDEICTYAMYQRSQFQIQAFHLPPLPPILQKSK